MNLSFRIHKNIDLVYDYLTDMQEFVSVHPVITKIDHVTDENYKVHETLKFGIIPFSFTYPVSIQKNALKKKIVMRASVFKVTKIEMHFDLKEVDEHTIIEETISFKSLLPIKSMMKRVFKKHHTQLFKNIEML